jgi:hypothetical protein
MQARNVFPNSESVRINGFGVSGDEFCAVAGCEINNVKATSAFSAANFCAIMASSLPAKLVQPAASLLGVGIYIKATPGVILENLGIANMAPQRVHVIGHLEDRGATRGGAGQKTRSQRVTGEHLRVEAGAADVRPYDGGNAAGFREG